MLSAFVNEIDLRSAWSTSGVPLVLYNPVGGL